MWTERDVQVTGKRMATVGGRNEAVRQSVAHEATSLESEVNSQLLPTRKWFQEQRLTRTALRAALDRR